MVAMRWKDNKGFRGPWGRGKKREKGDQFVIR
jgi:hypothetical protein